MAGLFGKHPAFGDFIAAGLPDDVSQGMADWMQVTLGAWRDGAGPDWACVFDQGPVLRFWIGPGLLRGQSLRGVWMASHDRSGRRFPLVVAQPGGVAPVEDADQAFYEAAAAVLAELRGMSDYDLRAVAAGLAARLPMPRDAAMPAWPTFWATNPTASPHDLMARMAAADGAHARAARSYWWFAPSDQGAGGALACQGWPGGDELGWLLRHGRDGTTQGEA